MKRVLLALLAGFLFVAPVMAQTTGFNQTGKVDQKLQANGFAITHPSLPIGSRVWVANTLTRKEIEVTVVGRFIPIGDLIADVSQAVWIELNLNKDSEVKIYNNPPEPLSVVPQPPIVIVESVPQSPASQPSIAQPAPQSPVSQPSIAQPGTAPVEYVLPTQTQTDPANDHAEADRILKEAKAEAEQILREARETKERAEADRIAWDAQAEADRIIREAQAEADRIRREALETKDRAEADRLIKDAQAEAESITRKAKEDADSITKKAKDDADNVVRDAITEADGIKKKALAEADNITKKAKEEADSIKNEALALANRMAREETVGILSKARAEAEGIKKDAQTEANRIIDEARADAALFAANSRAQAPTSEVRLPQTPVQPPVQPPLDVKITPSLPDPNNGKIYDLQVGAFSRLEAAMDLVIKIKGAGFDVYQEFNGALYRVIVKGIPASAVYFTAQRLSAIGIKEVWVK